MDDFLTWTGASFDLLYLALASSEHAKTSELLLQIAPSECDIPEGISFGEGEESGSGE